jgi:hypothetical protein
MGHAPLPADCQDMEQFEFESHVDRDERELKDFNAVPSQPNFGQTQYSPDQGVTAGSSPRQTYASRCVTGVEKRAKAPKPGGRARDTRHRIDPFDFRVVAKKKRSTGKPAG